MMMLKFLFEKKKKELDEKGMQLSQEKEYGIIKSLATETISPQEKLK